MIDYKTIVGIVSAIVGLAAFIPYYKDILRGTTKPHIFTWLVWSLVYLIVFIVQIMGKACAGAWFIGAETLASLGIVFLVFSKGEKRILTTDWICFGGAVISIVLWVITKNPLSAVIIAVLIEILAFAPTYRKAFYKPNEETASSFAWAIVAVVLSIVALKSYTPANWLYLASVATTNTGFVVLLLIRRLQIKQISKI